MYACRWPGWCVCAIAALVCACSRPTAPGLPAGAVRWIPPARFSLWWQMTESCSKRAGDLGTVEWYVVPNAMTLDIGGERLHGYWIGTPNRIVLADARRLDGPLVRHEMLHALLQTIDHPRDPFLIDCDGIVSCDGACDVDTGGRASPPESASEVSTRDVRTRLDIAPGQPAQTLDQGAVALVVSITNPRSEPVWVRLTPQGASDPFSTTFGIAVDYEDPARIGTSAYTWITGSRFGLEPGATRRYVWDGQLPAGRYGIRGYFNIDTAPRIILEVAP